MLESIGLASIVDRTVRTLLVRVFIMRTKLARVMHPDRDNDFALDGFAT